MKFIKFNKHNRFNVLSWAITLVIVTGIVAGGTWFQGRTKATELIPEVVEQTKVQTADIVLPIPDSATGDLSTYRAIGRSIQLKTSIPERPRYKVEDYIVARGDSIFAISDKYKISPETLLWANFDSLQDDPHKLVPGIQLSIPPVDGIYYQWNDGDTFESVADEYITDAYEILGWPGNEIDLTDPSIPIGSWVMVPGGEREFIKWLIPTVATGSSGTSGVSGTSCTGGAVGGGGFVWPTDNNFISGNDYWPGHLALDLSAGTGAPIYAADTGVVTMAQGGDNYGYGNVIQIDHRNGYSTLYAHLSVIGVGVCESVYAGQWIGASGSSGNSQGAHLHFEVRQGGGFINPWFVLP